MSELVDHDLALLAEETAQEANTYLLTLRELAAGGAPTTALPLLLLACTGAQAAGARLGAMVDVVPHEQFETDSGPDANLDGVRQGLHALLAGVDDYVEVEDPVLSGELIPGCLSDDLTQAAADLGHGLAHHRDGRTQEALWWWQFSYLSVWGERLASATRVLHSLLAHVRLDADEELVMEAQMAALHAEPPEPAPAAAAGTGSEPHTGSEPGRDPEPDPTRV